MPIDAGKLRDLAVATGQRAERPPQRLVDVALNAVQLTGRLVEEPELCTLSDGSSVCHLRLAIEHMGHGDGTGFADVQTFGTTARECARSLSSGWTIAVAGRLRYGEWDNDAGVTCSGHTVTADRVMPVRFGPVRPIAPRLGLPSAGTTRPRADEARRAA